MSNWQKIPSYPTCFVCGKDNPIGLKLDFRGNGSIVEAEYEPQAQHCGYQGIVHGGIISAILDEGMGWTGWLTFNKYYLTMELKVRLKAPVKAGEKYLFRGELAGCKGNIYFAKGAILDADGKVAAAGEGKFYMIDLPEK